jgi:hypothetical protein
MAILPLQKAAHGSGLRLDGFGGTTLEDVRVFFKVDAGFRGVVQDGGLSKRDRRLALVDPVDQFGRCRGDS